MNKSILIFLLITNISFCQDLKINEKENPIVGRWYGIDSNGMANGMILDNENYITFISKGESFGGKEFDYKDQKYIYKYQIDYNQNPIQLDFILYEKESGKEVDRFKAIIRFIDINSLEMRRSETKKYPKKFSSKKDENTIFLKRSLT